MQAPTITPVDQHGITDLARMVADLLAELGDADDAISQAEAIGLTTTFLACPDNVAFCAWTGDQCVGGITIEAGFAIYVGGRLGTIRELFVTPPYRSAGVGRKLLNAACDHARTHGWRRLEVAAPDQPKWVRTRDFYLREGFLDAGPKLKRIVSA